MKIIFMGTPEFAAVSLRTLLSSKHQVAAVFTQPDKPVGRGYKLTPPPVKVLAEKNSIPVHQFVKLRDAQVLNVIREIMPDVIVVVAYGRMLPVSILESASLGCINVHGSLLPKYRGAAPIQWSVISGDEISGVSIMYMAEGMDTGDIILKEEILIGEDETSGELFKRMADIGANALIKALDLIENSAAPRIPQDDSLATYAPMLTKDMCELDFTKTAKELHNQIRGLSPWPVAVTEYEGKRLKIHRAKIADESSNGFTVKCSDGAIEFLEVQLEGGKRMNAQEFMRGRKKNV